MTKQKKSTFSIDKLIISVGMCLLAGFLGSLVTMPAIETWYQTLTKPFFTPPNWVFGPVWTTLYILMGVAFYLLWRQGLKSEKARYAALLFGFQLILNVLWSYVFFGLQSPILGFVGIVLLLLVLLLTIRMFALSHKTASYLLVPYVLWVSFASLLNLGIVLLNI